MKRDGWGTPLPKDMNEHGINSERVTPNDRNLPLISVITVVRNDASGIEQTILSVVNQTHRHLEYIVIDGASTDGTLEIIQRYSDRITHWKSEPDHGIANAFNKGVELARGDLMIFMNSGDSFFEPETLAKAIRLIPGREFRTSIFYGDTRVVDARRGAVVCTQDHETLCRRNTLCHQSVLIGSDVQKHHLYDERLSMFMDYDVWLRCLGRYPFVKLPLVISNYATGGFSAADSGAIQHRVERTVVQLLNRQRPASVRTVATLLAILLGFVLKRKTRQAIGDDAFFWLQRLAGRDPLGGQSAPATDRQGGELLINALADDPDAESERPPTGAQTKRRVD